MPSLPSFEFKIGIPPYGGSDYSLISSTREQLSLPSRIVPVPQIESSAGGSVYKYHIDEDLYSVAQPQFVQALGTQIFREHPFIPYVLNPFIYDGDKQLTVITSARILINLQGNISAKSAKRNDPMANVILDQMLNAESAQHWTIQSRAEINFADFSRSPWWMRIETDETGIYRINPGQLSGFPIAEIDPRSFRIFSTFGKVLPMDPLYHGEEFAEIPIHVIGEEDGSFDTSDYILFYGSNRNGYEINSVLQTSGQKIFHNPYSKNVVYWLTFAGDFDGPPQRMQMEEPLPAFDAEMDHHREVVHVETEAHRRRLVGYTWYMSRMFGSSTLDYAFDVNLPDLDPSDDQVLEFRMRQEDIRSELWHSITVFVNDVILPSNNANPDVHTWYSTTTLNFSQETSAFRSGNNRIVIRVNRGTSLDNLFLDFYRVTYNRKLTKSNQHYIANAYIPPFEQAVKYDFNGATTGLSVFKINAPGSISQIPFSETSEGFSFTAIGDASTSFVLAQANDYYSPVLIQQYDPLDLTVLPDPVQNIIITPVEFLDQAHTLADMYQQNWGYLTKVVLQKDIFNQFNGGHPDPAAIRQYLRYVYHNAPEPRLQGLTLLGLGTLDWRNFSSVAAPKNKIVIFQDPSNSLTSDDYFVMLTNDRYPELAVGRYPVSNINELNTMIANFRNYTQNPTPGLWRNSVVLLADDNVNGDTTSDWQHTQDMQSLSNMINPSVLSSKIFAAEYDFDEFLNKPKVRDALFEEINEGKLIFYYVGHGSFDILGMQDYLNVSTDLGRFQNPDRLPLFIAASCEVSQFDYWAYESLAQKTVLMNNAGAIASVGATRSSYPNPNHSLMSNFVPNMLNSRYFVGYALIDAKLRFTAAGPNDDMYILMGDPNLRIVPPESVDNLTLESLARDDDITVHSRQNPLFSGVFTQDGLQGEATFMAYDSKSTYQINYIYVSQRGPRIFRGNVSVSDSEFEGSFFVPDDVIGGDYGLVLSYIWDQATAQDYVSYHYPLPISGDVLPDAPDNVSPPQISIYLGSFDFRAGDTVSTSPVLYARIADENGINVTGSAGHNILLVIDNSLDPIVVTDYFQYDKDSHTAGTLQYPLPELSEGYHTVQLIAFDNHNLPEVTETHFMARKSGPISLENLLVYPNPMKDDGHITFIISDNADITLDIFTMSGKRIRRIETFAMQGFNQIAFDGRDEFGARLANNTYFIRLRAKTTDGKTIEKRERMVIYK